MVAAVAVELDQLPSKEDECNEWFDGLAPALSAVPVGCPACLRQIGEHSVSCAALGRFGSKHFLARFPRTVVQFSSQKGAGLWPTALCQRKRMINKGDFPAKRLSPLDCMCDALRRAKELALEVGFSPMARGGLVCGYLTTCLSMVRDRTANAKSTT